MLDNVLEHLEEPQKLLSECTRTTGRQQIDNPCQEEKDMKTPTADFLAVSSIRKLAVNLAFLLSKKIDTNVGRQPLSSRICVLENPLTSIKLEVQSKAQVSKISTNALGSTPNSASLIISFFMCVRCCTTFVFTINLNYEQQLIIDQKSDTFGFQKSISR